MKLVVRVRRVRWEGNVVVLGIVDVELVIGCWVVGVTVWRRF